MTGHCPTPTRRAALSRLAALAGLGAWPAVRSQPPSHWRIPGSFEPVAAVWMGFDAGHAPWTAQLALALAPHAPIKMLVASDALAQQARETLFDLGVAVDGLVFHVDPQAGFFLQDAAVFAVGPQARPGVVDFVFNRHGLPAWCARRFASDREREADCAAHALNGNDLARAIAAFANARVFDSPLALEGGAVEVNGRGLMIVNEAVMRTRNPDWERDRIEQALLDLPGVRKLIWLPQGLAEDAHLRSTIVGRHVAWGAGGHTDQFVRFADPRTVLLAWPDDGEAARHPVLRLNRERMQRNFTILSRERDADGRALRVIKLPLPRGVERAVVLRGDADTAYSEQWTADDFPVSDGHRQGDTVMQVAPASYLNYVVANAVVVVPDYLRAGTPKALQRRVQAIFERAFPGRQIVFVDSLAANWYAGGPHCAVLSEPRA